MQNLEKWMVKMPWNKGSTWIEFLKFCFNVCVFQCALGGQAEKRGLCFSSDSSKEEPMTSEYEEPLL